MNVYIMLLKKDIKTLISDKKLNFCGLICNWANDLFISRERWKSYDKNKKKIEITNLQDLNDFFD